MISLETSIRVWGIRDILFALSRSALRNSANSQANHDSPLQSIRINLLGTRKKPCIPKWLSVLEDLLHVREKQFGPQQQQRFVRGRAMLQRHLSGVAGKKFPRERSERWLSEGLGKRKTTKTIKIPWKAWGHIIKKCSIQYHSTNLPRSYFFHFLSRSLFQLFFHFSLDRSLPGQWWLLDGVWQRWHHHLFPRCRVLVRSDQHHQHGAKRAQRLRHLTYLTELNVLSRWEG